MSIHLLECAARRTDLPAATKLALMCLADSASSQTRIAFPGLDEVMTWSGLSRSRSLVVLGDLVDAGLLARHKRGHRGRRAEFVVFPDGCCDAHPMPVDDPDDDEEKGSRQQDSSSVKGSRPQDPKSFGSGQQDPFSEKGSRLGPASKTPSPTPTTNPPTPLPRRRREVAADLVDRQAAADRRARADAEIQASRRRRAETANVDGHAHAAAARELLAAAHQATGGGA